MELTWKCASPKSPYYFIANAVQDGEALSPAFESFWRKLFVHVLPHEASSPWDHVRCELWIDDGFIVLKVADSGRPLRRTVGAVKLLIPTVRKRVDDNTVLLDDAAFDAWLSTEIESFTSLLIASLERCKQELPWALVQTPGPLQVLMFEPEELEPLVEYRIERPR